MAQWLYCYFGIDTLERATFHEAKNHSNDIRLKKNDAKLIALGFAENKYKNFSLKNMQLISSDFWNYGSGCEYEFVWKEVLNNVETCNFVLVSVNPNTGEITKYLCINRDIYVSLNPHISEDDAIKIAITQLPKNTAIDIINSKLSVEYPNIQIQKLTYIVEIEGRENECVSVRRIVVVDAVNGDVLK